MRLGVGFVGEVNVVGGDEFDAVFAAHLYEPGVDAALQLEGLRVGVLLEGLVTLELEVVVVAEHLLVPQNRLLGLFDTSVAVEGRDFAGDAGGTDDKSLAVFLKMGVVRAGAEVEAVGPCLADELHQVVIPLLVFSENDEVRPLVVGGVVF